MPMPPDHPANLYANAVAAANAARVASLQAYHKAHPDKLPATYRADTDAIFAVCTRAIWAAIDDLKINRAKWLDSHPDGD